MTFVDLFLDFPVCGVGEWVGACVHAVGEWVGACVHAVCVYTARSLAWIRCIDLVYVLCPAGVWVRRFPAQERDGHHP